MSRSDLRALFHSNSRELKAVDVFTDREDEWAAVIRSLENLTAATGAPDFDVNDLESPRRNVLVFYGVGGIGKSALSREIAEQLAGQPDGPSQWSTPDPPLARTVPVRIDLARQAGVDFESVVLAVRLALTALGRPMPAFDLALRRYWEHNHPGEPVEEHLRGYATSNRAARSLSSQMQSVLADVAQALGFPATIGALMGKGLRTLVRTLRDRKRHVLALAECHRLPDLLEADPNLDVLSYCAHLLAWDLAHLPREHTATPVVLLDTFEDVSDRGQRDHERLIQRMVWLMPNALFVITGRNRLQWDDERLEGQLDWVGTRCWPLTAVGATEEPRQHLVGHLSRDDCESYLANRLSRDGKPVIPPEIREVIAHRSRGLPLYLDLAVMRFLSLYQRSGDVPRPEEFNHDFTALVARAFRDLTTEERHVARAVSLLDSFSVPLAAAAAGLSQEGPVLRLIERPVVDSDQGAVRPHRLHDLVRSAILEADSTGADRWSPADWQRAAQRAFDALGREWRASSRTADRRLLVDCLLQGLRLARDFDLDLAWLVDAAFAYVQDCVWEPVVLPPPSVQVPDDPVAQDNPAAALAVALTAIAGRQRGHRRSAAERLRVVVDSGRLPVELAELPRYFLAECDRDLGNFAESLAGMRWVVDHGRRLAPSATRGLLHLSRRLGHFRQARALCEALGAEGRGHRASGEIWWPHGHMTRACASFAHGREEALRRGEHGEAALAQACLAFAAAFQDRHRADEQIERAERMLAGAAIRWAELQVRIAQLLRNAGDGDDLPAEATAVAAEAKGSGLTSSVAYAWLALCFHMAVLDSGGGVEAARARLREHVNGAEFAYLLEISHMMTGTAPPADLPLADWVDGAAAAGARWRQLVLDRRQEMTAVRGS
ncbi:ATP/GTP-binding protein [Saccharothrix coeruleofusca]|uniref:ATP/GTP-binding protein n=1 Tax=Saccharothrix coeruleofusca TaxID=33919 RepID=A0A918APF0_9PSEU|nr:ATP/GTP-binding protein [Saccharothrix coeruleofusca]GGP66459.1 ATP/GTP-binding protein [Saccharothrix coeruleofusca]